MDQDQTARLDAQLRSAGQALAAFSRGPAAAAAEAVGAAFETAASRISTAFVRAAGHGEVSVKQLAKVVLEELARIALDRFNAQSNAPQRSSTPSAAGAIGAGAGSVSVHFHLSDGGDGGAILRHQGQIAAEVARAVSYGRRNL